MSWFVFELRREGSTMTELEEFPLLEAALKHAIDDLMLLTRANRQGAIGVGEMTAGEVDWLGELRLDAQGRPIWNSRPSAKAVRRSLSVTFLERRSPG